MEVSEIKFVELAQLKGFFDLTQEYEKESKIAQLPAIDWQPANYLALERAGSLKVIAAKQGDRVLGFAAVIISVIPHYNKTMATVESIFVGEAYRKSGAGLKLIKAVEQCAKDAKARALFLTAPVKSRLTTIAPRLGYNKTNEVFTKTL